MRVGTCPATVGDYVKFVSSRVCDQLGDAYQQAIDIALGPDNDFYLMDGDLLRVEAVCKKNGKKHFLLVPYDELVDDDECDNEGHCAQQNNATDEIWMPATWFVKYSLEKFEQELDDDWRRVLRDSGGYMGEGEYFPGYPCG